MFLPGTIAIATTPLEGVVSPRPNGNEVVNIHDWIQEGRFVAALDIASNGSEFQRTDCAPLDTHGDGQITVADWVQVGRFAVGLDPLTAFGGPTSPQPQTKGPSHPVKYDDNPALELVPLSQSGQANSVSVELVSTGNVNSVGFSIAFSSARVQFVSASLGSGATGAAFIQNTNQASIGRLGFVVGALSPAAFAMGTQPLVNLTFASVSYSNTTVLSFSDTPVTSQLADVDANILTSDFVSTTLSVGGSEWPTLSISEQSTNAVLSWPSSGNGFSLQASSALDGEWTNVAAMPITDGSTLLFAAPLSTNAVYYRLKY